MNDAAPTVVEVAATETHELRRTELRVGTASSVVEFDGDFDEATFHLAVRLGDDLVAISSWMRRPYPDRPDDVGFQLRGMATSPAVRGTGVGSLLLDSGLARCHDSGASLVWARSRVTALGFYQQHGFAPVGSTYLDLTTGLDHRDIVLPMNSRRRQTPGHGETEAPPGDTRMGSIQAN